MLGKLALPEIRELIEAHDDDTLREVVNRWHSADLADLVSALRTSEQVHVLRLIKPRLAADAFAYLDLDTQQEVLQVAVGRRVEVHLERDGARRPDGAPGRAARPSRPSG